MDEYLRLLLEGGLPVDCAEKLAVYASMIEGARMNLVRYRDGAELVRRHLLDSLGVLQVMDWRDVSSCVDVGSGAGLPAVPLSVLLPHVRVVAIESVGKKARFIEDVARRLELNLAVMNVRAEAAGITPGCRESFDVAVARAVGPVAVALEYCVPLVKVGGDVIIFVGRTLKKGIPAVLGGVAEILGCSPPRVESYSCAGSREHVMIMKKVSPTPDGFPRREGRAAKSPLDVVLRRKEKKR